MAAPPESAWRVAVRDAVDTVREHGTEFVLVLLGTTIPALLRKTLLGLRVAGFALLALGAFAILRPDEFRLVLPYLMGATFVLLGGLALWMGARIRDATSAVRLAEKAILAFRERAPPRPPPT